MLTVDIEKLAELPVELDSDVGTPVKVSMYLSTVPNLSLIHI